MVSMPGTFEMALILLSEEPVEQSKVKAMAADLGIGVEGKTDDELLDEIRSYAPADR